MKFFRRKTGHGPYCEKCDNCVYCPCYNAKAERLRKENCDHPYDKLVSDTTAYTYEGGVEHGNGWRCGICGEVVLKVSLILDVEEFRW